ncbi:ABC transporter permease [Bosea psychrotolerans]|uniref:Nucleoside ABC transporter membrane protein n=1 Tax=Bosea psychrotolerans TaxID=1871628 RepID=A0A2S4M2M5_9HYPH|nr:ABC transporter permease [Bosea psychrotolerans]POR48940.1 nucleoside ABC transporter membrane protein [Bosea psychrotolerans]
MLEWRRRREPSSLMLYASPLIAVLLTMLIGMIVFSAMGYDGFHAVRDIFLTPFLEPQRWPDLGVKAAPLVMIALGLAIGFRANVWNIGAEGQYIMGAIAGTGVALATYDMTGWWILPAMALAGILGGMAWAAIPAFLRVKLGVSEILTSLMLTYVAVQGLYYLVRGPWKDPDGFNFPQTRMFTPDQTLPVLAEGSLIHLGIPLALVIAVIAWLVMEKTTAGYAVKVVGLAPAAARHGGFSSDRVTWATLLAGGGLAGLAGLFEAAGPFGQLTPQFPTGYGFTAIIVAFLGRLNPLGIVFGGIVLAATYVGGEIAQTTVKLPQAATGMFQALLLFMLLATDVLVRYRIGWKARAA